MLLFLRVTTLEVMQVIANKAGVVQTLQVSRHYKTHATNFRFVLNFLPLSSWATNKIIFECQEADLNLDVKTVFVNVKTFNDHIPLVPLEQQVRFISHLNIASKSMLHMKN